MKAATFDVVATLEQYLYAWLKENDWHPRITIAPAEWDRNGKYEYLRLIHVGGEVEIIYRPHGKRVSFQEQKWRRARDASDQPGFIDWLGTIKAFIQTEEAIPGGR